LAAAGAVNHDELVKMASDAFGSIPDEDTSTSVRTLLQKVGHESLLNLEGSGFESPVEPLLTVKSVSSAIID
jgi:predicted Zn-dependent peptidase